jgi:hypothetical protein
MGMSEKFDDIICNPMTTHTAAGVCSLICDQYR